MTVTSEFLVALIAGFASDVELYLLDEPTSGLDPLVVRPFHEVVAEARSAGSTVLLSSHVLAEVEALCDRVSIIRDGVVVESGSLAELRHLTRSTLEAETEAPIVGWVSSRVSTRWSDASASRSRPSTSVQRSDGSPTSVSRP